MGHTNNAMLVYMTPYTVARRFIGLAETPGAMDNPAVLAMLRLDDTSVEHDETPWCSAFVNWCCWLLEAPRSKSLAARSWLRVGHPIPIAEARAGHDLVIFTRAGSTADASILKAPGHVGFFVEYLPGSRTVRVLGGNQDNRVSVADFPLALVLGVRRLS